MPKKNIWKGCEQCMKANLWCMMCFAAFLGHMSNYSVSWFINDDCPLCMSSIEYTPSIDEPLNTVKPVNLEITVSTITTSE